MLAHALYVDHYSMRRGVSSMPCARVANLWAACARLFVEKVRPSGVVNFTAFRDSCRPRGTHNWCFASYSTSPLDHPFVGSFALATRDLTVDRAGIVSSHNADETKLNKDLYRRGHKRKCCGDVGHLIRTRVPKLASPPMAGHPPSKATSACWRRPCARGFNLVFVALFLPHVAEARLRVYMSGGKAKANP